ncbi:MAG: OsmC family protein [Flavobacteriales bacterium]|nr:OsmC family protein [Flavobacteriales bacterium]
MEITLKKTEGSFQFLADNKRVELPIIASPELSGSEQGYRPMELLLVALGSCMAIDVMQILEKQKQKVEQYESKVFGQRADSIPAIFESITVEISVVGEVDEGKLKRAVNLSADKYCSVYKTLNPATKVEFKSYLNHGR